MLMFYFTSLISCTFTLSVPLTDKGVSFLMLQPTTRYIVLLFTSSNRHLCLLRKHCKWHATICMFIPSSSVIFILFHFCLRDATLTLPPPPPTFMEKASIAPEKRLDLHLKTCRINYSSSAVDQRWTELNLEQKQWSSIVPVIKILGDLSRLRS